MKKIFALFAVLAVMIVAPSAQAQSTPFEITGWREAEFLPMTTGDYYWARVVNCNEWISLREYPSTSAPRLARIPLGTAVKVLKDTATGGSGDFYRTYYNGMSGWCLKAYIRLEEYIGGAP